MTMELKRRKRNRTTIVCQRCRLKKARCDRSQPCGACVKAECPDSCIYETNARNSSSRSLLPGIRQIPQIFQTSFPPSKLEPLVLPYSNTPASSGDPLNGMIADTYKCANGVNPVISSKYMINLHMDFSSCVPQEGTINFASSQPWGFQMFRNFQRPQRPPCFTELSQQEPGTRLFWRQKAASTMTLETLKSFDSIPYRDKLIAAVKTMFGTNYIPSIQEVQSQQLSRGIIMQLISNYGKECGLFYDSEPTDDCLIEVLKAALPDRASFLGYVDRFFKLIYPIYPILDETWVESQISNLFKFSPRGELTDISISSHNDELIISIILSILRLSYSSFFSGTTARDKNPLQALVTPHPGSKALKDCQVSLSVASFASNFCIRGSRSSKVLLLMLQANLMQYILKMYSPESEVGFSALHTSFNHAHMVQMATTLLMERDPSYFMAHTTPNERASNLRRKIWYVLVRLDLTMSFLFSSPRLIHLNLYNTRLPQFSPGTSNIRDLILEEEVCALMSEINNVMNSGGDLIEMAENVSTCFKASDLLQALSDFELQTQETLGPPSEYLEGQKQFKYKSNLLLTLCTQTQLILKLFIGHIHYCLYLFFKSQAKADLEFFFLRKVLSILFSETNIYRSELLFSQNQLTKAPFFFFMNPILIIYSNCVALVGIGLFIRLNCSLLLAQNSMESPHLINQFAQLVQRCEAFVLRKLKLCKLLSEHYFQAWKCLKGIGHGCKLMRSPTFFGDNLDYAYASAKWTKEQREEIFGLIREDLPEELRDVQNISEFCYSSDDSMDDCLLKGHDLLKTIQTDNFWICMNSLLDNEKTILPLGLELELGLPLVQTASGRAESGVVDITHESTTVATRNGVYRKSAGGDELHQASELDDINAQKIIDFNVFNTDWSVEDFLQWPF